MSQDAMYYKVLLGNFRKANDDSPFDVTDMYELKDFLKDLILEGRDCILFNSKKHVISTKSNKNLTPLIHESTSIADMLIDYEVVHYDYGYSIRPRISIPNVSLVYEVDLHNCHFGRCNDEKIHEARAFAKLKCICISEDAIHEACVFNVLKDNLEIARKRVLQELDEREGRLMCFKIYLDSQENIPKNDILGMRRKIYTHIFGEDGIIYKEDKELRLVDALMVAILKEGGLDCFRILEYLYNHRNFGSTSELLHCIEDDIMEGILKETDAFLFNCIFKYYRPN